MIRRLCTFRNCTNLKTRRSRVSCNSHLVFSSSSINQMQVWHLSFLEAQTRVKGFLHILWCKSSCGWMGNARFGILKRSLSARAGIADQTQQWPSSIRVRCALRISAFEINQIIAYLWTYFSCRIFWSALGFGRGADRWTHVCIVLQTPRRGPGCHWMVIVLPRDSFSKALSTEDFFTP